MFSYHIIFFAVSSTSASILSRPGSDTSLLQIVSPSDRVPSSNAANVSLQRTERLILYECGDGYYGTGAHADSCDEALRTMAIVPGSPTQQFTWGDRRLGQYDIPLPQRWVSC